jgi:hypothetical protein
MRLRSGGSATRWGFAIYLAGKYGYQDSILPTGAFASLPKDAPRLRRPLPRRSHGLKNPDGPTNLTT